MSNKLGLAHGDVYPSYIAWLRGGGSTVNNSSESVNVAAGVARTEGGWIGLNLWIMCPDSPTAENIIPAVAALLSSYDFRGSSDAIIAMLSDAVNKREEALPDKEMWPDSAGPLKRKGVKQASRR